MSGGINEMKRWSQGRGKRVMDLFEEMPFKQRSE